MQDTYVKTVEAGYAKVYRDNRLLGHVREDKHGSTRTGTMWFATTVLTGERLAPTHTRAEAVAALVAWRVAFDARRPRRRA